MDSVSQLLLGAAVGQLTLGKVLGRKALVIGAVLGTLPDLDVLVRYSDAVESFTFHRSWSHSIWVLTAFSFALAAGLRWAGVRGKLGLGTASASVSYRRWWIACWLILITHPILDAFTIYGTQLWWPLPVPPVAIGSIFIIDPLYTLPLLLGVLAAAFGPLTVRQRRVAIGLTVSTAYLALTVVLQQHAASVARSSLERQAVNSTHLLVAPSPMSLLWRLVARDDHQYHEGFYSVFDQSNDIDFQTRDAGRDLLGEAANWWPVTRLDWFTDGFIAVNRRGDALVISDLRMGLEADYVFEFEVARHVGDGWAPIESQLYPLAFDSARVQQIWRRVWDESISLEP